MRFSKPVKPHGFSISMDIPSKPMNSDDLYVYGFCKYYDVYCFNSNVPKVLNEQSSECPVRSGPVRMSVVFVTYG